MFAVQWDNPDALSPTLYVITVTWCALTVAGLVFLGLWARSEKWCRGLEIAVGSFGLVFFLSKVTWFSLPANADKPYIPLHLCNLAEIAGYISLLTRWYWLRPVLYFWSLGAIQAFVTPEMREGPVTPEYWFFWGSHAMIFAMTAYEIFAAGFRPSLRDFGIILLASVIYLAVVFPLNLLIGSNFGYVGPERPNVPSLIDFLGPWPLRVLWMALLGIAAFLLAWLPWEVARMGSRQKSVS